MRVGGGLEEDWGERSGRPAIHWHLLEGHRHQATLTINTLTIATPRNEILEHSRNYGLAKKKVNPTILARPNCTPLA